jgi:hypothetical protein
VTEFVVVAILVIALLFVLKQMFNFKPKAIAQPATPRIDLSNLKITDAKVGDNISVAGAAADFSDLDFTVEHRNEYEAGERRWFDVGGMYRETRVSLEVVQDDDTQVRGVLDPKKFTLDELGLLEEDLSAMDGRQNPSDSIEFQDKVWMYRWSKEVGIFRDGQPTGTGFYCWTFQEEGGKRWLQIRKFASEPFAGTVATELNSADITVYRGS